MQSDFRRSPGDPNRHARPAVPPIQCGQFLLAAVAGIDASRDAISVSRVGRDGTNASWFPALPVARRNEITNWPIPARRFRASGVSTLRHFSAPRNRDEEALAFESLYLLYKMTSKEYQLQTLTVERHE
ncbi:hypothetical protein [Burkholderia ubonensis]|uniref:hypothetical protein n=1 Tax=Burkholderia ubonensis TaxID=101571 RepID=UPI0012FB1241|nr:hypothetical protein [Burkholderia ubonensis]